ncbi:MAG: ABC transporter permease [Mobilitalea sp.]
MKVQNRKIANAISIKFKNIITSPAIKVTLLIAFLASGAISFLPYIINNLLNDKVTVYSQIPLEITADKVELVSDINQDADLLLTAIDENFLLRARTQNGYNSISLVIDAVQKLNFSKYLSTHELSNQEKARLTGSNISVEIEENIVQIDDKSASFLMMLTMLFFMVMTLLVSRIGTQVAFEKGNKITETILTSITKKQLFFSQTIASVMVAIISFMVASIPMIVAYIVKDPKIVSDFTFFTPFNIAAFLFHLITVAIALIIFSVGIGSCVKQAEDANTMSVLILIPTLLSYVYYIFSFDLYKGIWTFLNYIPIFSVYSIFGGILRGTISRYSILGYCLIDILFLVISFFIIRKLYCKKL